MPVSRKRQRRTNGAVRIVTRTIRTQIKASDSGAPLLRRTVMDRELATKAPELLTAVEAIEWCHSTVGTLQHLRPHGRAAPAVKVGKCCFWMLEDLLGWLAEQEETA